jgi:hypothetical protein
MPDSYETEWRAYRKIRLRALLVFLGYIPCMLAVGATFLLLLHFTAVAVIPFFLAYALLMCVTFFQLMLWGCPRCGHIYGRFRYDCKQCGLRKWAGDDEEVAEAGASDSVIQ